MSRNKGEKQTLILTNLPHSQQKQGKLQLFCKLSLANVLLKALETGLPFDKK